MMVKQAEELTLRLERLVRADRARVFAAWTEPEELAKWSAPKGLTIPEGDVDLRVGGRWRVVMVEPDGRRHEAFGRYLEVTPPERLVYTHQWVDGDGSTPETTLTLEFHEAPGGTRMVLTQVGFADAGGRDGHEYGWSSALDNLVALFE
ncbi:MAG: SRPBCC family protein [Longimicrobiales bacterium]